MFVPMPCDESSDPPLEVVEAIVRDVQRVRDHTHRQSDAEALDELDVTAVDPRVDQLDARRRTTARALRSRAG
jgi:hypothetical protein